jgi:4-amino-4-deoxy-L-arabinose transferase-like glycosyltransferase
MQTPPASPSHKLAAAYARLESLVLKPRIEPTGSAPYWLLAALLAAGLWVRLSTLGSDSLWVDELYSWAVTRMDMRRILTVPFDVHPPLFYATLKVVTAFGQSEAVLRAPSAICGLVTVGLVFAFARRYCGATAAMLGSAVVLFSYKHIVHSSNARNYVLMLMLCVAASWALGAMAERLTEDRRPARSAAPFAVAYGLLALAALMTHTVTAIYLFVLSGLMLLGVGRERPGRALRLAAGLALANAPAYGVWVVWYLRSRATASDFEWQRVFKPVEAAQIFAATFVPNNLPIPVMLIAALFVLAGVFVAMRRAPAAYWVPVVAMSVVLPATLYIVSFFKPIYMERTVLLTVPGAGLAVAALVAGLRGRRVGVLIGAALVAAYVASAWTYVARGKDDDAYGMQIIQDFRGAMQIVDSEMGPGAALLTCDTFSEPALRYYGKRQPYSHVIYLGDGKFGVRQGRWEDYYGAPASQRVEANWAPPRPDTLAPFQRLIYLDVSNFCTTGDPALAKVLAEQGFARQSPRHVQGLNVQAFVRKP